MYIARRHVLKGIACAGASLAFEGRVSAASKPDGCSRVPLIDITDLYHPPQDPGDNIDLIAAYALPEVDLRAVILDVTQRYRRPFTNGADPTFNDPAGGRDPGFIPVTQLNYIFDRSVPCATGPFASMRSPEDPMRDTPAFQQMGVEGMLLSLRQSNEPVEIASFGSARPLAVAYNRDPKLMREKVRRIHLCAGAAPAAGFIEWNVQLDVHAFVRLLRSDLPIAIYPCGAEKSAWDMGQHNTYWKLLNMEFVRNVHPRLQSYLAFAIERSTRMDYLCAVEDLIAPEVLERICKREHSVWETAVWAEIANRRLVRCADGTHRLVPAKEVAETDKPISSGLRPVRIDVKDDGQFAFEFTDKRTNFQLYYRENPLEYQDALREAFPAMYTSFLKPA